MTYQYSFNDCLQRAERINWRVEDLIGDGLTLNFSMPFMPESLARTAELPFLSADEKRTLNQSKAFAAAQHQANRWTYIGSGMSHLRLLEAIGDLSPTMRQVIASAAPGFS